MPNKCFIFAAALLLQGLAGWAQTGRIGSDRCAVCHVKQSETFSKNPHKKAECESCHGPGLAHVEALNPDQLTLFHGAQPNQVNDACLTCHAKDHRQERRFESAHSRNGIACVSCHRVHSPDIRKTNDALCSSCHRDIRATFERPFGHKLSQGAIHCVDCHDPHGSQPNSPLRLSGGGHDYPCFKCHTDKRGPFPYEHAPIRTQLCSTCHDLHGSANPRMLARNNVSQLCLECHTMTAGVAGGSPPAFHDLRVERYRQCTVCHVKIHGSYAHRDFLR